MGDPLPRPVGIPHPFDLLRREDHEGKRVLLSSGFFAQGRVHSQVGLIGMNNVSPCSPPRPSVRDLSSRAIRLLPAREVGLSEKASLHDNLIGHGDNLIALSLCCRPTTAR